MGLAESPLIAIFSIELLPQSRKKGDSIRIAEEHASFGVTCPLLKSVGKDLSFWS
jgi:hypothetical protein